MGDQQFSMSPVAFLLCWGSTFCLTMARVVVFRVAGQSPSPFHAPPPGNRPKASGGRALAGLFLAKREEPDAAAEVHGHRSIIATAYARADARDTKHRARASTRGAGPILLSLSFLRLRPWGHGTCSPPLLGSIAQAPAAAEEAAAVEGAGGAKEEAEAGCATVLRWFGMSPGPLSALAPPWLFPGARCV